MALATRITPENSR